MLRLLRNGSNEFNNAYSVISSTSNSTRLNYEYPQKNSESLHRSMQPARLGYKNTSFYYDEPYLANCYDGIAVRLDEIAKTLRMIPLYL